MAFEPNVDNFLGENMDSAHSGIDDGIDKTTIHVSLTKTRLETNQSRNFGLDKFQNLQELD